MLEEAFRRFVRKTSAGFLECVVYMTTANGVCIMKRFHSHRNSLLRRRVQGTDRELADSSQGSVLTVISERLFRELFLKLPLKLFTNPLVKLDDRSLLSGDSTE
jgi:hypothetical protein